MEIAVLFLIILLGTMGYERWRGHREYARKQLREGILVVLHCKPRAIAMNGWDLLREVQQVLHHPLWCHAPAMMRTLKEMEEEGLITSVFSSEATNDQQQYFLECIPRDPPYISPSWKNFLLTQKGHTAARMLAQPNIRTPLAS